MDKLEEEFKEPIIRFQEKLKKFKIIAKKITSTKGRRYRFLTVYEDHFFEAKFKIDGVLIPEVKDCSDLEHFARVIGALAEESGLTLISCDFNAKKNPNLIKIKVRQTWFN